MRTHPSRLRLPLAVGAFVPIGALLLTPVAAKAQDEDAAAVVSRITPGALTAPEDAAGELQDALAHERSGDHQVLDGERLLGKARREDDAKRRAKLEARAKAAFEAAVADFTAAIPIRPDAMKSYVRLGQALRGLRRFREALAVHEAALRRSPADEANLRGWLETLHAVGRLEDAMAAYPALAKADPARAATLLGALDALVEAHREGGEPDPGVDSLAAWLAGVHATQAAASPGGG